MQSYHYGWSPISAGHHRRNDKRVLNRLLLKSNHLRESQPRQELHIEDLFHGGLEFQHCTDPPAGEIHGGHTALELTPSLSQWHTVHRRRSANLGQTNERESSAKSQAARKAGQLGYHFSMAADGIEQHKLSGSVFQEP